SLLKYAEKTAEAKGRELNDRMAEQQALMESQQKEMQKVAKAREELEAREHRFETAKAELEARAKALEQREKRLKQLADSLEGERTRSRLLRAPGRASVRVQEEERGAEQRHEDQGTEQMVQGERNLGLQHRGEGDPERAREERPFPRRGPQVIGDRQRHTDRRQEGHRLHAEQHPRTEPAPEDPDEHVPGDDEERDAGHRSHHVSAIGRAPLDGLQDRE